MPQNFCPSTYYTPVAVSSNPKLEQKSYFYKEKRFLTRLRNSSTLRTI